MNKKKIISISDYCQIHKLADSADTIVAFSSYKTPKGKFRFIHALENFEGNIIYINSKKGDDWYINGIEGIANNYVDAAKGLREIIKDTSGEHGKIITTGGSMGGYGAVLYGSLMNADYSFASGVELIMNLFIGLSYVENKIESSTIEKIISRSRCTHNICVGAIDPVDMINYSYFKDNKKINWFIFKNKPHNVIEYIHKKYDILNILNEIIKDGKPNFHNDDLKEQLVDYEQVIDEYLYSSLPKILLKPSIGPRKKKMIRFLYKKKEYEVIVKLLENSKLDGMDHMALIYFDSLLKTGEEKKAQKILPLIKKEKYYNKAIELKSKKSKL